MDLYGLNEKGGGGVVRQKTGRRLFASEISRLKSEVRQEMSNEKGERYGNSTN